MSAPRKAHNPLDWPEWSPPAHEPASSLLCGQYTPTDDDRAWAQQAAETMAELQAVHAADAALQRQLDAWRREIHGAPEPELLDTDTALAAMAPQVPPRVTKARVGITVVVLIVAAITAMLLLHGGVW